MTLPREIIPGRFYMVIRRCTQRQMLLLLRPDHTVVFDRHGTLPAFTEHFHKLLAKCQNALRGR